MINIVQTQITYIAPISIRLKFIIDLAKYLHFDNEMNEKLSDTFAEQQVRNRTQSVISVRLSL